MASENPSVLHHVSVSVSDHGRALSLYDKLFAVLGGKRVVEEGDVVAYGKQFPEFWVHGAPFDGGKGGPGNGIHFAFFADSKAMVDSFYEAALAAGATGDGAPGPRPHYGEPYYGCFVRDFDGHKLEATFWNE